MKPVEQLARETYENCYKIAEIRRNSEYTSALAGDMHLLFKNMINLEVEEKVSDEARALVRALHSLDEEFYPKLRKLAKIQK